MNSSRAFRPPPDRIVANASIGHLRHAMDAPIRHEKEDPRAMRRTHFVDRIERPRTISVGRSLPLSTCEVWHPRIGWQ